MPLRDTPDVDVVSITTEIGLYAQCHLSTQKRAGMYRPGFPFPWLSLSTELLTSVRKWHKTMNHRIVALCPQHIYVTFRDQYEVLATAAVATPVFGHSLLKTMSPSPATVSIKNGAISKRTPRLAY